MAYVYSLSTECGPDKSKAELFASHFLDLSFELVTGHVSRCSVAVHPDEEHNWWVDVYPDHITRTGGSSLQDAIEVSEVGFRLYGRLRSAPQFRYSLFGCEVSEFRLYSELADEISVRRDGSRQFDNSSAYDGLVLNLEVWESLGRPIAFFPFADNYRWRLYPGLEHSVIYDDTDYGRLLEKLQADLYPNYHSER